MRAASAAVEPLGRTQLDQAAALDGLIRTVMQRKPHHGSLRQVDEQHFVEPIHTSPRRALEQRRELR